MIFCFTVDDIGYSGYSTPEHLDRLLAFFDAHAIRATFFTVPIDQGIPLGDRPDYVQRLKAALAAGHEVGQHGLEHDRFEFGIPPQMILDLPHETANRERVARERDAILAGLTVPVLRERLARGRHILESALDAPVCGFRAPALSICDNLFVALEAEGYRYDSSRHFQDAAWDLLVGKPDIHPRPINRERFQAGQTGGRMQELMHTADYTWYLTDDRFDKAFALARHDFEACREARIPFVVASHVSPIFEGDGDNGLEFYRNLIPLMQDRLREYNEPLNALTLAQTAENRS